jgi:Xaa-Pro aminopeptidase
MSQSRTPEVARKLESVARFLHEQSLDRVLLQRRGPVGWLLAGVDTHVRMDTEEGVALVSVDRAGKAVLFTDVIEAPRLADEELRGLPIEVVSVAWTEQRLDKALEHARQGGAEALAAESPLPGVPGLGAAAAEAFRSLRYELGAEELLRYRRLCHDCAIDLEAVAGNLEKDMTEHEVAADLMLHVVQRGYRPTVVLVAFDERIERFRHPVPTHAKLRGRAMVVLCAEHGGQVMAATRLAGFTPPRGELAKRTSAVLAVDAAANAATRPGAAVRDVFARLVAEYREQGYPDEWLRHHQGGSIGYAGREYKGTPDSTRVVRTNQAFAWNPSIAGTKCEDTLLAGPERNEFLTATGNWPTVDTIAGQRPTELLLHG